MKKLRNLSHTISTFRLAFIRKIFTVSVNPSPVLCRSFLPLYFQCGVYESSIRRLHLLANYSSSSSIASGSPDDLHSYHRIADATLSHLLDELEAILDNVDIAGGDVEMSNGVITLRLGAKGTFVINKQPPNRQIWVSSPLSGPKRFDYVSGSGWLYARDQSVLQKLLSTELAQLLSISVALTQPSEME